MLSGLRIRDMVFNIILKIPAYSITQNRNKRKLLKKERKTLFADDNIITLVDPRRLNENSWTTIS